MSAPGGWRRWLALALLLLGLARVAGVVLQQPLAGYANQYDMLRAHACLGLWPAVPPGSDPAAAAPAAPIPDYRAGATDPANCHWTTDVVLARLAFSAAAALQAAGLLAPEHLPLRAVGLLKLALLAGLALLLHRWLRAWPGARLLHALLLALVLADPFNTLFLNTLYTESGALLGAYALCGALAVRLLRQGAAEPASAPANRAAALLVLAGALALAAARFQHLPLLLAQLPLLLLLPGQRRLTLALLLPLLLAAGAHLEAQQRLAGVPLANRADALFGAVLPASADRPALLARLGLPPQCEALAFRNWYLPAGRELRADCPAAFELGHGRIALALLAEPRTLLLALLRGLPQSTAWRLNYVGERARGQFERLPPGALGWQRSLADVAAEAGLYAHLAFWWVPLLFGLQAVLALAWQALRRPPAADPLLALQAISATVVALGWAASVFGDGYSELARHLHLAINAALCGWLLLAARAGRALAAGFSPRASAVAAAWTVLALLGVWSAARLPLATGRATAPELDRLAAAPGAPLAVAGWMLSPRIPVAVELCLDGTCSPASVAPDANVGAFFPLAGRRAAYAFNGSVAPVADRAVLEVWLLDAAGQRTLVERRALQWQGAGPELDPVP